MINKDNWSEVLLKRVDGSSIGLFRFVFGLVMIWQVFYVFDHNFVEIELIQPAFHFTFGLFDFLHLKVWPANIMHAHFTVMGIAAIAIALGLLTRFALGVFFLTFLYAFLLEKSIFNNHYYLILLITFLLMFADSHRWFSLDKVLTKKKNDTVNFWPIFLLRMQVVIVYFYGAINKLNYDWIIRAQPMKNILAGHQGLSFLSNYSWAPYLFSYGGFFADLFLCILLFSGRYRWITFTSIVLFNYINAMLFGSDIGVFPVLMIGLFVVFLDPHHPREFLGRVLKIKSASSTDQAEPSTKRSGLVPYFVIFYLLIQVLVPLRHWFYPGPDSWTHEGNRFAWKMKLNIKDVYIGFNCVDPKTEESMTCDDERYLSIRQFNEMGGVPDMLLQYSHFLRDQLIEQGITAPEVYVFAKVALNGRPYQPMIDPDINLADVEYPFLFHAYWIEPLIKTR